MPLKILFGGAFAATPSIYYNICDKFRRTHPIVLVSRRRNFVETKIFIHALKFC